METSLERSVTDPCYGANYDPAAFSNETDYCLSGALFNDIQINSGDWKGQKVMIVVSTISGYLSFNKNFWNDVDPVFGRRSMASGNVTFRAYPDDLTKIFSNLHYGSFTPGQDSLDIELRYGDCIAHDRTSRTSQIPLCHTTRGSIPINVLKDPKKYKFTSRIVVGFPWQVVLCVIGYPLLYVAVIFFVNNASDNCDETATTMVSSTGYPLDRWIQHTADDGMYYYENTEDGAVTWQAPHPDEGFIRRPSGEP